MKQILLVKLNHIGDTLLMTPTIRFLKQRFPHCAIDVIVRSGCEGVLQGNRDIRHLMVAAHPNPKNRTLKRTIQEQWKIVKTITLRRYDFGFDLSNSDRAKLYLLLSAAKIRGINNWKLMPLWKLKLFNRTSGYAWGPHHQVLKDFRTVTDVMGLEGEAGPLVINTEVDRSDMEKRVADLPWHKPYVVIHPTSRWQFKQWLPESWAEVADRLNREKGLSVVFSIGPGEVESRALDQILAHCQLSHTTIRGALQLRQLAYVMEHAALFLGVDTVAMHLAAAVQLPAVALFGPSSEWSWSPWLSSHQLVLGPCDCKKTRKFICDKSRPYPCMEAIRVETVMAQAEKLLRDPAAHAQRQL
uniref:Putative GT9: lipopolysaccharide heptosyltransferase III n=1 Tax=Magnetococcus massalia (strain MO-1) TaxID=451514 RepID=A0A1S7LHP8_MAGMO|nr:Putative GT9 : lipopolysaccharide heptosyltransferase III [Candidatus Magnetococcus massalia]